MNNSRIEIGRDVIVVREQADGLDLEGSIRLRPGRDVEIVAVTAGEPVARKAIVWSWNIVAVGRGGPRFRGTCCWTERSIP